MRNAQPTRRPVAVTGMATTTPAGVRTEDLWSALLAAKGTLAGAFGTPDAGRGTPGFACRLPAAADERQLALRLGKLGRRLDPATRLGVFTALNALADAGLTDRPRDTGRAVSGRFAVVAGTAFGASTTLEAPERGTFFVPMAMHNALSASISLVAGFTGPSLAVSAACATGAVAVGEGVRLIREGIADVVVAGGAELLTAKSLAGIGASGALSARASEPLRSARPFDADRDGTVASEGAAFVVLESLDHAARRAAREYGRISGYATTCDAHHLTSPSPGGEGAAECMRAALADAAVDAADITHVNAHATSTPVGDAAEAQAIASVFGPRRVPVTANKGVTGHMIAASGAAEAVASLLALAHAVVPPTANTVKVDDALEIDLVMGRSRALPSGPVLSSSFGFGGHNAALVLLPTPHGPERS
ncbi:beta-ketoacyl-[acyl-carrier-protein] synthase family protein [Streptomyces sp. NPDC021093]|uniref:beta-ketoacyl-[acyl-carrier-protein] synthase family protein n=1 Tax=Streptomyces sp. NPDC021093 TaxID=3365112 RepID=UPI003796C0E7